MDVNAGGSTSETSAALDYSTLELKKIGPFWVLILGKIKTKFPKSVNTDPGVKLEKLHNSAFIVTSDHYWYEVTVNDCGSIALKLQAHTPVTFQGDHPSKSELIETPDTNFSDASRDEPIGHAQVPIETTGDANADLVESAPHDKSASNEPDQVTMISIGPTCVTQCDDATSSLEGNKQFDTQTPEEIADDKRLERDTFELNETGNNAISAIGIVCETTKNDTTPSLEGNDKLDTQSRENIAVNGHLDHDKIARNSIDNTSLSCLVRGSVTSCDDTNNLLEKTNTHEMQTPDVSAGEQLVDKDTFALNKTGKMFRAPDRTLVTPSDDIDSLTGVTYKTDMQVSETSSKDESIEQDNFASKRLGNDMLSPPNPASFTLRNDFNFVSEITEKHDSQAPDEFAVDGNFDQDDLPSNKTSNTASSSLGQAHVNLGDDTNFLEDKCMPKRDISVDQDEFALCKLGSDTLSLPNSHTIALCDGKHSVLDGTEKHDSQAQDKFGSDGNVDEDKLESNKASNIALNSLGHARVTLDDDTTNLLKETDMPNIQSPALKEEQSIDQETITFNKNDASKFSSHESAFIIPSDEVNSMPETTDTEAPDTSPENLSLEQDKRAADTQTPDTSLEYYSLEQETQTPATILEDRSLEHDKKTTDTQAPDTSMEDQRLKQDMIALNKTGNTALNCTGDEHVVQDKLVLNKTGNITPSPIHRERRTSLGDTYYSIDETDTFDTQASTENEKNEDVESNSNGSEQVEHGSYFERITERVPDETNDILTDVSADTMTEIYPPTQESLEAIEYTADQYISVMTSLNQHDEPRDRMPTSDMTNQHDEPRERIPTNDMTNQHDEPKERMPTSDTTNQHDKPRESMPTSDMTNQHDEPRGRIPTNDMNSSSGDNDAPLASCSVREAGLSNLGQKHDAGNRTPDEYHDANTESQTPCADDDSVMQECSEGQTDADGDNRGETEATANDTSSSGIKSLNKDEESSESLPTNDMTSNAKDSDTRLASCSGREAEASNPAQKHDAGNRTPDEYHDANTESQTPCAGDDSVMQKCSKGQTDEDGDNRGETEAPVYVKDTNTSGSGIKSLNNDDESSERMPTNDMTSSFRDSDTPLASCSGREAEASNPTQTHDAVKVTHDEYYDRNTRSLTPGDSVMQDDTERQTDADDTSCSRIKSLNEDDEPSEGMPTNDSNTALTYGSGREAEASNLEQTHDAVNVTHDEYYDGNTDSLTPGVINSVRQDCIQGQTDAGGKCTGNTFVKVFGKDTRTFKGTTITSMKTEYRVKGVRPKSSSDKKHTRDDDDLAQSESTSSPTLGVIRTFFVELPIQYCISRLEKSDIVKREMKLDQYMKWNFVMHSPERLSSVYNNMKNWTMDITYTERDGLRITTPVDNKKHLENIVEKFIENVEMVAIDIRIDIFTARVSPESCVRNMLRSRFGIEKIIYAEALHGKVVCVFPVDVESGLKEYINKELRILDGPKEQTDKLSGHTREDKTVCQKSIETDQNMIKLFEKLHIENVLKKQFPKVTISTIQKKGSCQIHIVGSEHDLERVSMVFKEEYENKLVVKKVNLGIQKIEVFTETGLLEEIESYFERNRCCCVVTMVQGSKELQLCAFSTTEADQAATYVRRIVTEEKIIITGNWKEDSGIKVIKSKFAHKYKGVLLTIDTICASVYGTGLQESVTKLMNEIAEMIKEDSSASKKGRQTYKTIMIEEHDAFLIIKNDSVFLDDLQTQTSVEIACIELQERQGFSIKGESDLVLKCEKALNDYQRNITAEITEYNDTDTELYIRSKDSLRVIKTIETETHVTISINSKIENKKMTEVRSTKVIQYMADEVEGRHTWIFPKRQQLVVWKKTVSQSEANMIANRIEERNDSTFDTFGVVHHSSGRQTVEGTVCIPTFRDDKRGVVKKAKETFTSVLRRAEKDNEESVAFPVMTLRSWTLEQLTQCLIYSCGEYFLNAQEGKNPRLVILCVDDTVSFPLYVDCCKTMLHDFDRACLENKPILRIVVEKGSLNETKADVLVNTTSQNLDLKAGAVSVAILKTAGSQIQNECRSKYPKGVKVGEIAVTGGYNLQCGYVFHGSIPQYASGMDMATSLLNVRTFVNNCLEKATELEATTIAFPAIGTGNLRYPSELVAEEMFNCVKRFEKKGRPTSLKEVRFVVYHGDVKTLDEFKKREAFERNSNTAACSTTLPAPVQVSTAITIKVTGLRKNIEKAQSNLQKEISSKNHGRQSECPSPTMDMKTKRNEAESTKKSSYSEDIVETLSWPQYHRDAFVCNTQEHLTIRVYQADILNLPVDCIVNAANAQLNHSGGIAKAIAQAAGQSIITECRNYVGRRGELRVGKALVTTAGQLDFKCIIHAVGPCWSDYKPHDNQAIQRCRTDLREAIFQSLEAAKQKRMTSIAFPAISSALCAVPKEMCATEYANAVLNYSRVRYGDQDQTIQEVHFVDRGPEIINIIKSTFNVMIHESKTCPHSFQKYVNVSPSSSTKMEPTRPPPDASTKNNADTKRNTPTVTLYPFYFESNGAFTCRFSDKHEIRIYTGDILTVKGVETIVCCETISGSGFGKVAQRLVQIGTRSYTQAKADAFKKKHRVGDIVVSSGGNSRYKWVVHAIVPHPDEVKWEWKKSIQKMLDRIFEDSATKCYSSMVTSLLGTGVGRFDPQQCAELFLDSYTVARNRYCDKPLMLHMVNITHQNTQTVINVFKKHIDKTTSYLQVETLPPGSSMSKSVSTNSTRGFPKGQGKFGMSMSEKGSSASKSVRHTTAGDGKSEVTAGRAVTKKNKEDNCVICMDTLDKPRTLKCGHTFCTDCITQHFKHKQVCPTCGAICGKITGDQPEGRMEITKMHTSLAGFEGIGTIAITYTFQSGRQSANHPKPGASYMGISRTAFLPDNDKGRRICSMLRVAFNRKLVFTIGASRTTGQEGVITWNDIHQKTDMKPNTQFGYPDSTYLARVIDELRVKGVTEADIDQRFLTQLKSLYGGQKL